MIYGILHQRDEGLAHVCQEGPIFVSIILVAGYAELTECPDSPER
jgi:hypothetical protein